MREIKFRQAIYSKDIFDHWHYWGFLPDLSFVGPDSINGLAHALSNSQQFTGHNDKNGKESYAGDKLKDTLADIGIIHWEENVAGFYVKWADGSDLPINTFVAVNKCEIFGNVHQPELIKN